MKLINIEYLLSLSLATFIFFGCTKQEVVSIKKNHSEKTAHTEYTQPTDEIQDFLSKTPLGSEIYLEEKESGEWYLKIEKTFTVQKDHEKTEISEPIYGESILI